MKLIYFCAGSHQLSRPLNILNCLEMDSHNRVLVIQRSGSWGVGVSLSSPSGMMSLKSPSASCSLAFDGAAGEVLQPGCHQSSSWRAQQLYFCVCSNKTTLGPPGSRAEQSRSCWKHGIVVLSRSGLRPQLPGPGVPVTGATP